MIDPVHIGETYPLFQYEVTRPKIRELALAIGDPNPIYHDLEAARAAGYADVPIPPTFPTLFSFWAEPSMLGRLAELGVDLPRVLHGEEEYDYRAPIVAGDLIAGEMTLVNARSRRGMEFITLASTYRNQRDEVVAQSKTLIIVREA